LIFGRRRNSNPGDPANGAPFLSDGPAATKAWAMCGKIGGLFLHNARLNLPDDSLWRMTSNAFYFTVNVGPLFAQLATDAPKAGLF